MSDIESLNKSTDSNNENNNKKLHSKRSYLAYPISNRITITQQEIYLLINHLPLRNLMLNYGYTPAKVAQFENICAEASEADRSKDQKYSEKNEAHRKFIELLNLAKNEFKHIANVAKIALRNHEQKRSQLGLEQKKRRDIAGIFNAMQKFYDNILCDQEVIDLLAVYSFDRTKIEQFQALFLNARAANSNYTREFSLAMESTRVRDQKMALLDEWMTEYYTMRKVAEGLGV